MLNMMKYTITSRLRDALRSCDGIQDLFVKLNSFVISIEIMEGICPSPSSSSSPVCLANVSVMWLNSLVASELSGDCDYNSASKKS